MKELSEEVVLHISSAAFLAISQTTRTRPPVPFMGDSEQSACDLPPAAVFLGCVYSLPFCSVL